MAWVFVVGCGVLFVTIWILTGLIQRLIKDRDDADDKLALLNVEIARMAPMVAIVLNKAAWDDNPGQVVTTAATTYLALGVHPLVREARDALFKKTKGRGND